MNRTHVRSIFAAAAILFSLTLVACGGGSSFNCNYKGSCPNDTAPSSSSVAQCQAFIAGACGSQYQAFGSCAEANATCDANGVSQISQTACASQEAAVVSCCQANPSAAGCS